MQKAIKRGFDIIFSVVCSLFAIPIVIVSIFIIHFKSPESPVMFNQTRVGYKGKKFTIYKLRTMTNDKDNEGNLLPDEMRLKPWGKVFRKLSIDELTQIFNILAGQMSWIGPRPLLPREMAVMTEKEQEERQSFLPGITGWEAVNEAQSDNRRTMAEYDLYYVRNWSLGLDLRIFFKTISILLRAKRADDELRAPKFKESDIISKR